MIDEASGNKEGSQTDSDTFSDESDMNFKFAKKSKNPKAALYSSSSKSCSKPRIHDQPIAVTNFQSTTLKYKESTSSWTTTTNSEFEDLSEKISEISGTIVMEDLTASSFTEKTEKKLKDLRDNLNGLQERIRSKKMEWVLEK